MKSKEFKISAYKKQILYVYMAVLTIIICYFASKIYKTDELIWPRERYIIVVTMVLSFYMVLLKLFLDKKMELNQAVYLYHFILLAPFFLMIFPLNYYELRPLYLIPMIVVLAKDLSLGLLTGIAVIVSTYVMIFTNLAEFMYIAFLIMVLGCLSASQIHNLKKFLVSTLIFWAGTFYLCGLYRYFDPNIVYDKFQYKFAAIGLMVAAACSLVIFFVKYWVFFIRIKMFASENSIPMMEIKEKSISLYYHSVEVGNLAKSAAASIGADIRLSYAAGLLHDIGKLENAKDIRDYLRVANEYGIPKNIKSIIVECSGKYRKPASKEAAIVMLADSTVTSVEYMREAKKDMSEEKIIDNVFSTRVNNASLSNSGISLEELYLIKKVFLKKYNC